MRTMSATEVAGKIGREHRRSYRDEFGNYPERVQVGDRDASGIETMRRELDSKFDGYDLDEAREEYLDALFGDGHERVCAYCGETVGEYGKLPPPPADDDHEWAALARMHAADCEWVATRAHRREVV